MVQSVDMRGTIDRCTTAKTDYYFAVIDGKVFQGYRGRTFYRSPGSLKRVIRESAIGQAVKKCADNYFEFVDTAEDRVSVSKYWKKKRAIRDKFWKEFLNSDRITIKGIDTKTC